MINFQSKNNTTESYINLFLKKYSKRTEDIDYRLNSEQNNFMEGTDRSKAAHNT
jgi:hypothetical protein